MDVKFGTYMVTDMYLMSKRGKKETENMQKLVTTGLNLMIKHFLKSGLKAATMNTVVGKRSRQSILLVFIELVWQKKSR